MNIIVIGNGFDLAHGLPTKYTDFLSFVKRIQEILNDKKIEDKTIDPQIVELIETEAKYDSENEDSLYCHIDFWENILSNNFWIDYFLNHDLHGKENWIDFESEISSIIQSFHNDMHGKNGQVGLYDAPLIMFTNEYLEDCWVKNYMQTNKELKDKLYDDLNKMIKALEIYLSKYIDKLNCDKKSPDILDILATKEETKVLCFNYTNSFSKIYCADGSHQYEIDYIHGKAEKNWDVEMNNMVLGIDEFLLECEQRRYTEFIEFKKFYQRIYKQTGCKYKDWVDDIKAEYLHYIDLKTKEAENKGVDIDKIIKKIFHNYFMSKNYGIHNLYIYGHSLDITDGDILKELILNNNVHTTIFFHNRETMGKQIANLVKVIGEDELIKRTGGMTKTIEFKLQKEMM